MEPPASTALTRAVIISDAKRGHENQSRVIARMLGDLDPLVLHLRPRIEELPLRLRLALFGRSSFSQARAAELVRRNLQPEQPEQFRRFAHSYREAQGQLRLFTISSGTPPATYNLVAARMLGATAIVNMTPSLLPRQRFELNIVPEHDLAGQRQPAANVISAMLALGYHDQPAAALLAGRLAREHGLTEAGKYLALCLGGPTRDIPYPPEWCAAQLRRLLSAAKVLGLKLLITTSRRTPQRDTQLIAALAEQSPEVAYFLDAQRDPLNPLPAFYELAAAIVITADSFSMVSEALHAGHQPVVLVPPGTNRQSKVSRSLWHLAEKSLLTLCDGTAADTLQRQLTQLPPRAAPNAQYEQLRSAVRRKLGLG